MESIYARRSCFWRILLSGMPNYDFNKPEDLRKLHDLLDGFRIGLLSYPYRDPDPFGETTIFRLEKKPDSLVSEVNGPKTLDEISEINWPKFTGAGSVMDYLVEYFGLDKSAGNSPRAIRKKYSKAFSYGWLPGDNIHDFAALLMRAARIIIQEPDTFNALDTYISVSVDWNKVDVRRLNPDYEDAISLRLGNVYF
ncbi:hypothetical protein IKE71_01525 [Candidatus Saccharibacteria bacterium]|nr:hypothetical protein [Candidatus Saccharibacteria bacterium]